MCIRDREQTVEQSMNSLYDYFCLAAGQHHVQMFHAPERTKFAEDCTSALKNHERCVKRGRDYTPRFTIANAPVQMQEYLLRLFAGGYNTLYAVSYTHLELNDLEAHHSWTNVINTATFELGEAGVAKQYRSGLAAFLCAAYIEKQPILLIGPNAIDIIQAFSAAVTGHKHGRLCCEGSYNLSLIHIWLWTEIQEHKS